MCRRCTCKIKSIDISDHPFYGVIPVQEEKLPGENKVKRSWTLTMFKRKSDKKKDGESSGRV